MIDLQILGTHDSPVQRVVLLFISAILGHHMTIAFVTFTYRFILIYCYLLVPLYPLDCNYLASLS